MKGEKNPTSKEVRSQVSQAKSATRSVAKSSAYSMSDPRILTGNDRTKFVTTVMNSTMHPELADEESQKIGMKVMSKTSKLITL